MLPAPGSTRAERSRLAGDLARLHAAVTSANQLQQKILAAHSAKDATALASWLQGPATTDGLSLRNAASLPVHSFEDYYRQVRAAVADLQQDLKDDQWRRDLRALYEQQVQQNDIVADEVAITCLGLEIAEQGRQVADIFKLAQLDKQIAELEKEWAKLEKDARDDGARAMELRLGLAEKTRALAAAKFEALKEAVARAEQLTNNAVEQLEAMQPRLRQAASKIREQKRKSGFFSFLKAIINVVGTVLTPFTGGQSLAIAAKVNQVIDIAQKIEGLDLRNPGRALQGIAEVAQDAAGVADSAIEAWGGADLKKARDDVKAWLRTAEQQLNSLSGEARRNVEAFLDGVRGLQPEQLRQLASVLGSDFPVTVKDGKVRVELGRMRLRLPRDSRLAQLWVRVLDEGGMLSAPKHDIKAELGPPGSPHRPRRPGAA